MTEVVNLGLDFAVLDLAEELACYVKPLITFKHIARILDELAERYLCEKLSVTYLFSFAIRAKGVHLVWPILLHKD